LRPHDSRRFSKGIRAMLNQSTQLAPSPADVKPSPIERSPRASGAVPVDGAMSSAPSVTESETDGAARWANVMVGVLVIALVAAMALLAIHCERL
jgi:hypothetical protein